jgi:CRISPR/Cas system Type II protein with McrA/HNH and RuvC-like nuclease domain
MRETPVISDRKEERVLQVRQEIQVLLDLKGLKDRWEPKVPKDFQVLQVIKDLKVLKDLQDLTQ